MNKEDILVLRRSFLKRIALSTTVIMIRPLQLFSRSCRTTQSDVEGPFYRSNAPARKSIADSEEGQKLIVKGKVFGADCTTPLKDATVDVWHASPKGVYDNRSEKFLFRGQIKTDASGHYEFQTLLPGIYASRPRHIHYKIRHRSYRELTTQLYFKGDKNLNSDITARRNNGQDRAMPCTLNDQNHYEMTFDISLD